MLIDARRRMTPAEKARRFDAAYRSVKRLALIGLRLRHPLAEERELELRYAARRIDAATMRRAFGWDPGAPTP